MVTKGITPFASRRRRSWSFRRRAIVTITGARTGIASAQRDLDGSTSNASVLTRGMALPAAPSMMKSSGGRKRRAAVRRQGGTMVTRKTKATGTRRRAMQPEPRRAPTALEVRPRVAKMKARLDVAGRRVQVAGTAATKFARSSVREMTTAAKASREPMHALWRNVRLAGRHIARDAVAMWHEVVPAEVMKLPVVRGARRPAA
jgi:hypothetical protein